MDDTHMQGELKAMAETLRDWVKREGVSEETLGIIREITGENRLENYTFHRPFCNPKGGIVQAYSLKEAHELVQRAYGYVTGTTIYHPLTKEKYSES